MKKIKELGRCPGWVKSKPTDLVNKAELLRKKSKKLVGLRSCYSIRVASNYRMIFSNTSTFFLCSHDHYDKKIKNMKRQEA
ncbi:ParE family toxin-like protein [Catenovulum sediminis]|uniref:ParE-like toxin domain-containing protein n=1 Tax=Catenovulum sediminis TaxID=1740262 RepID=A0ABV1RJ72_9ALTE